MSDLSYDISVNSTQAQRSVKGLEDTVGQLSQAFSRLGTVIGAFVSVATLRSANAFAATIKDISDAADVSTQTVIGLGRAFELSGGTIEKSQNSLLKFTQTVGEAVAGSSQAQKAFAAVGISLRDIQELSQEELLARSIQGVSKLDTQTARLRAQVDLFGKASRTVAFTGVQETFAASVRDSERYRQAIESADKADENLAKTLADLKTALLLVLEPLNKLAGSINVGVSAFESLIKAVIAGAATFLFFKRVFPVLKNLQGEVAATAVEGWKFKDIWVAATGFIKKAFSGLTGAFSTIIAAFRNTADSGMKGATVLERLGVFAAGVLGVLSRFAGIAGIIYTVAQAVDFLLQLFFKFSILDWVSDKFGKLVDKARELFGLQRGTDQQQAANNRTALNRAEAEAMERLAKAEADAAAKRKEFAERQARLRDEVEKTTRAFDDNNTKQLENIRFQTALTSATEDQKEILNAVWESLQNQNSVIDQLLEKRREWAKGTEEQKASLFIIDQQIAQIRKLGEAQRDQIAEAISLQQTLKAVEAARLADIEAGLQALERRNNLELTYADIQREIMGRRREVSQAQANQGETPLMRQIREVRENARSAALEAGRTLSALYTDDEGGVRNAEELAQRLGEIATAYKDIADAQVTNILNNYEQSRSFEEGWGQAFSKFKDNAMNASLAAQSYFETMTQGFENAIVRFVRTGKLSFRDLILDMIAQFAKLQAQRMFLQLFGGGGGGGLFGRLLGGIGFGTGLGFGNMDFGGFFANGGTLGAGKFGIAGESGPELVTGPANIIPLNQMAQPAPVSVNYTINAVDAASFRQLISRDPQLIYNLTEVGRRAQPSRRLA